jgi:hypothetical protein
MKCLGGKRHAAPMSLAAGRDIFIVPLLLMVRSVGIGTIR